MKKTFIILFALLFVSTNLFSGIDFKEVDDLHRMDKIDQSNAILEKQLQTATSPSDKSEIYWRLSRSQVAIGDKKESDKDKIEQYELGIEYAEKSIELKDNWNGYLWKLSNIGRKGQTEGILNSLSAAKRMRGDLRVILDDFNMLNSTETWYVLGNLYTSVPGGFISFGNKDFGISYYRVAVDTIPNNVVYPNHYKELAKALYNRNWSKNKRSSEIEKMYSSWNSNKSPYDKYAYYEGKDKGENIPYYSSVALNQMSDRQEAVMVLNYAIAKFNVWPYHTEGEKEAIEEVKILKSQWT